MSLIPVQTHDASTPTDLIVGQLETARAFRTYRPQGWPLWLLVYNETGKAFFRSGEVRIETGPGDAVLLAPGAPHDYGSDGTSRYRRSFAAFLPRTSWEDLLAWPERAHGLFALSAASTASRLELRRAFGLARREFQGTGTLRLRFAENALERVLLLLGGTGPAHEVDPRVARAAEHLVRHLDETWRLEPLARKCGLSVSRFVVLFRDAFGCTPQRFIEERRLARAVELLRYSSLSIGEIALETGFSDALYFSRRFKRRFGRSPRLFRGRPALG